MNVKEMAEEAKIAAKQAEQDIEAAADAQRVIDEEGGVKVSEFEEAESHNRGL